MPQARFIDAAGADIWLLTEVRADTRERAGIVSALRPGEADQCWAAITSRWQIHEVPATHPALVMAYVDAPFGPLLTACSVLPWRGARNSWPEGDGESFEDRWRTCLRRHSEEIAAARRPGEEIVWDGDFNQALQGRDWVGSRAGRDALTDAFVGLGLRAVTRAEPAVAPGAFSIDHVAVPATWSSRVVVMSELPREGDRPLSDHRAYVVTVPLESA